MKQNDLVAAAVIFGKMLSSNTIQKGEKLFIKLLLSFFKFSQSNETFTANELVDTFDKLGFEESESSIFFERLLFVDLIEKENNKTDKYKIRKFDNDDEIESRISALLLYYI